MTTYGEMIALKKQMRKENPGFWEELDQEKEAVNEVNRIAPAVRDIAVFELYQKSAPGWLNKLTSIL